LEWVCKLIEEENVSDAPVIHVHFSAAALKKTIATFDFYVKVYCGFS
jgi:hypothetical protein